MTHFSARFASLFLLVATSACSGSSGGSGGGNEAGPAGTGSIFFEATDAPIDPRIIERAVIEVDSVLMHREADGDSGFVTVFDGGPVRLDLANLNNGLTQPIGGGFLEPGSYSQARLHVVGGLLELEDGRIFSTEDNTLRLTSQGKSGYKVFLDPPIVVREGVETRVLFDFQLPKTYSPVPGNDIATARFFHLHPNVRVAVLQRTGELRGVISTTDAAGATIPASGAAVYVLPPGATDLELAVASTIAEENGMAAILGMPVGTYDVLATLDGRSGRAVSLLVEKGAVTSFEIQLE